MLVVDLAFTENLIKNFVPKDKCKLKNKFTLHYTKVSVEVLLLIKYFEIFWVQIMSRILKNEPSYQNLDYGTHPNIG